MALLRGRLFAGALFAGALFGATGAVVDVPQVSSGVRRLDQYNLYLRQVIEEVYTQDLRERGLAPESAVIERGQVTTKKVVKPQLTITAPSSVKLQQRRPVRVLTEAYKPEHRNTIFVIQAQIDNCRLVVQLPTVKEKPRKELRIAEALLFDGDVVFGAYSAAKTDQQQAIAALLL